MSAAPPSSSSSPTSLGKALVLLGAVVVGAGLWYWTSRTEAPGAKPVDRNASVPMVKAPPIPPPPPVVLHESAHELSDLIGKSDQTEVERIQYIDKVVYLYRQAFGGNPVGHNEQIVSALLGENEKGTALLPKDCAAIRGGFLVDQWGTPYWFHSVSAKDMEIRSAGPDKELFTDDDVMPEVRE
ncbi:MAG TPA: hypothetical protein VK956_18485 [Verrucomicrobium sp.]|nr:hypothetical protein [Verrucomicrobium sp.]